MSEPVQCPVCGSGWKGPSWESLAEHLVERAGASEDRHVMWLNRNVTKHKTSVDALVPLLRAAVGGEGPTSERVRR